LEVSPKNTANNAVVLDHQSLVDAGSRIAQDDFLPVVAIGEIAQREQVDAPRVWLAYHCEQS
jgi:hypothetical protein